MRPIIGACFICADCSHFSLCQNCYFTRSQEFDKIKARGHDHETHRIELIVEPRQKIRKFVKCHGCQMMPIVGVRYKCENCFDFDLCEKCYLVYAIGKKELKTTIHTTIQQQMPTRSKTTTNKLKRQQQNAKIINNNSHIKTKSPTRHSRVSLKKQSISN